MKADSADDIYGSFQKSLALWREKYARRPDKELTHLLLLALEREEIVSVGYRDSLMKERLARMPLDEGVRDLIQHALLWIWHDEEMHAIYVRGMLLRFRGLQSVKVFGKQLAGIMGGWAGSARQHRPWLRFPFSRALADLLYGIGVMLDKIPREVTDHLRYGPFRRFCLFNVEAERTAAACWERIFEIASAQSLFAPDLLRDFRRIKEDEDRHRDIFEILAASLDEEDRLKEAGSMDGLVERIGAVGPYFLPRQRRKGAAGDHPVGSGGTVYVRQGRAIEEKLSVLEGLLEESGLEAAMDEAAQRLGKSRGDLRVVIKPTFMMGYHRKDRSPLTDPAVIHWLDGWLSQRGFRSVVWAESRNLYDMFFQKRTVHEVARYFGISPTHGLLVDLSDEQEAYDFTRGLGQYAVGRSWKTADFRISLAKMRSHPIDHVFLCLGNMEGLGTRCDDFLFVERQAHRNTATVMLAESFPPHFSVLEAFDHVPDGLAGVMGCPKPQNPLRFYAGRDALAVDIVAARHMGLADPLLSSLLRTACHWFGDPRPSIQVHGPDGPLIGWKGPDASPWSSFLSQLAYPVYEFGSGRGALFVPEMDEAAFPLIKRQGPVLRSLRRGVQRLLGLRFAG